MPKIVETFPWWNLFSYVYRISLLKQVSNNDSFFEKFIFLELQNTQPSLQSTRNCLLLILNAFLVLNKKPLLYNLSEPDLNRNSDEQLSGNYPEENA